MVGCTENRWGISVAEPVVMPEKPEFLGEEHGSLNARLLELLVVDGQEGSWIDFVRRVGFGA